MPAVKFPVTAKSPAIDNPVSVPTLVIFGCAFVLTVPAVAEFKLATCVVELTTSGATPVVTFDTNLLAITFPGISKPDRLNTAILDVPPTATVTAPSDVPMFTLLVPLLMLDSAPPAPASHDRFPVPSVVRV